MKSAPLNGIFYHINDFLINLKVQPRNNISSKILGTILELAIKKLCIVASSKSRKHSLEPYDS